MSLSVKVPRQDGTDLSATTGNNDAQTILHQSSPSFLDSPTTNCTQRIVFFEEARERITDARQCRKDEVCYAEVPTCVYEKLGPTLLRNEPPNLVF